MIDDDLTPPGVQLQLDTPDVGIGSMAALVLIFSFSLLLTGCVLVLIAQVP